MSLPLFNKNYNEDSISQTAKADHNTVLKILIDTVWDFTTVVLFAMNKIYFLFHLFFQLLRQLLVSLDYPFKTLKYFFFIIQRIFTWEGSISVAAFKSLCWHVRDVVVDELKTKFLFWIISLKNCLMPIQTNY
jgi:hypothetical protein